MALIHNALRPGKVRSRPLLAREAGIEIFVRFSCCWGSAGSTGALPPGRLVFCSGCPLCLISLLLKETKLGDQPESGKRSCARVAERQTRWLQVPVSERVWGFKSPLAHAIERAPVLGPGLFCCLGRDSRPCSLHSPWYGGGFEQDRDWVTKRVPGGRKVSCLRNP